MSKPLILVPVDGSKFGDAAVPVALSVARALNGRVELISVCESEPVAAGWLVTSKGLEEWLEGYLVTLGDKIREVSNVPVASAVMTGSVAKVIEHHVSEAKPDLVVMSSHGRGALSRAWLGSVSDHVVRHVSVPVILVRPSEADEVALTNGLRFRRILIPLDGSSRAEVALVWARRIGAAFGASYTLARVVPPVMPFASPYLPHAVEETQETLTRGRDEAQWYLEEVAANLRTDGLEVTTEVLVGVPPGSGITRFARGEDFDLVAIATHGRGGIPRMVLGSVADKVVRGTHVPALVVRPPA